MFADCLYGLCVSDAERLNPGVERCWFYFQQRGGPVRSVDLAMALCQRGSDVIGFQDSQFFVGQDALRSRGFGTLGMLP